MWSGERRRAGTRSAPGGQRRPGPPGRRQRGRRGFTLLEILVAMAVLSIALVAIFQAFAATLRINTVTQGLWKAIIYVNNELARIERAAAPSVALDQGSFDPKGPMAGYAWRREVVDEQPLPGITVRKVLLEVTWDAAGAPQTYRSQIYVPAR